jgi:hypothetical protein
VHDPIFVDVLDARQDLLHEVDRFILVEPLLLDDVVEEFAAGSVLHNEVDVGFGLYDLGQDGVPRRVG